MHVEGDYTRVSSYLSCFPTLFFQKFQKLSAAYSKLTKDEEIDQDNDDAVSQTFHGDSDMCVCYCDHHRHISVIDVCGCFITDNTG